MENNYGRLFLILRSIARLVYPKFEIELNDIQDEHVVYISQHKNLFGPITMLMTTKQLIRPWILHVFFHHKPAYKHYTEYTFTERFGWNKAIAKLIAYPFSHLVAKLLHSVRGIPVYRGSRKIVDTFKESVEALEKGERIAIFPDIDYSDSSAGVKDMYLGFLHLEKYFYKKTGKHVCFVPLYISKKHRIIKASQPVYFSDGSDFKKERKVVLKKIQDSLNELAEMDKHL